MAINDVGGIGGLSPAGPAKKTQAATSATEVDVSSTSKLSTLAEMMKRLADLSVDEPDMFKEVTTTIAESFAAEAKANPDRADFLKKVEARFKQAAQTGNMSTFDPPKRPEGSAGGLPPKHHMGAAAYAIAAQQQKPSMESVTDIIQSALQSVGVATG